jgi:hypothetical protein
MLRLRSLNYFLTSLVIISSTACSLLPSNASDEQISVKIENHMSVSFNNIPRVKIIQLIPKQENKPPLGIPQKADRGVGFATVILGLENPQETEVEIAIQKIEICNVSDETLQDFKLTQLPQIIKLKSLENSQIAFYLSNKTGYQGSDLVKAIVTYKIGSRIISIESEAVEVPK